MSTCVWPLPPSEQRRSNLRLGLLFPATAFLLSPRIPSRPLTSLHQGALFLVLAPALPGVIPWDCRRCRLRPSAHIFNSAGHCCAVKISSIAKGHVSDG